MKVTLKIKTKSYEVDFSTPIAISIPLREGMKNVNCFYAPPFETSPVRFGDFVGSTKEGGLLNFLNIKLNPHGNGTHTECVGHIAKAPFTINQCLTQFVFIAKLITIFPRKTADGDRVIFKDQIEAVLEKNETDALIIRTMPNDDLKMDTNYSGANPTYIHHEATEYLVACGVQHLLVDLPSVDREEDGGKLLSHKAFWKYPEATRTNCTITELIYVNNEIKDDFYLLNIQIGAFEIDVSPSKPILYKLSVLKD